VKKLADHVVRVFAKDPFDHGNPALTKTFGSLSSYVRVGVFTGDHHFRDTRRDDSLRAGRRTSMVVAGLQGAIQRGVKSVCSSFFKGICLCMGCTRLAMHAFGHNAAILDHDRADTRVRADESTYGKRQVQCPLHVLLVSHDNTGARETPGDVHRLRRQERNA
jgi:hypothetical protein